MKLSDFDFDLPPELIAQHPVEPRDAARMLEVGPDLFERGVRDLPLVLRAGDLLVYNDTRVIKARLDGRRGDSAVEVTLHRREGELVWRAFARPGRKLRPGDWIDFAPGFRAEVAVKGERGEIALRFDCAGGSLAEWLDRHGRMPLPPYIKRGRGGERRDDADYQTVWGRREGAVAAPTAGLHFTPSLLAALEAAGIGRVAVTLHVGAGTFLPVKTEDVRDHVMHEEWGEIGAETVAAIERARAAGGRIVAVGTTALRVMESVARATGGPLRPWSGSTDLFITPGFRFRVADLLITNFHLPRSTLFILVAAFAGLERMKAAYAFAIARRYRFFSYGDCCLIHRAAP